MTSYTYCTPDDVSKFLLLKFRFDQNSKVRSEVVAQYIIDAEALIDKRMGTSYKRNWVSDEVHDLEALRNRHQDFPDLRWAVMRPILLDHGPILPLDATRGHRIEVYEGSDTTPTSADPIPRFGTDFLASKTQGRDADWWCDYMQKTLHIGKHFLVRRHALVRVSYEWGFPITQVDGALTANGTTVTVDSTYRYPARGHIRVDDEYMFITAKTNTTFTVQERGALDTTAVAHSDNAEVYWVPDEVRAHTRKLAAALFLENERFIGAVPSGEPIDLTGQAQQWKQEVLDATGGPKWSLV